MTETQHVIALNPYRKGNKGKVFSNSMAVYDKVIASPEIRKMIQQIRGELPIPKVNANDEEAVKKAQDRLKSELPFFCPHYGIFKNNVRRQENAQPESFMFQTIIDVDDREYVDKAIEKARELNCSDSIWNGSLLHLCYSARKKLHIGIRLPVGMTIEETQKAYCEALGVPYDESCITPERMIYLTDKDSEIYRSKMWCAVLSEKEILMRRQAYLDRGLTVDGRGKVNSLQLKVNSNGKNNENNRLSGNDGNPAVSAGSAVQPAQPANSNGADAGHLSAAGVPQNADGVESAQIFPNEYQGIPYSSLVAKLIELLGGEPQHGSRNTFIFTLACYLRYICDDNAAWIKQVIPTFGEEKKRAFTTVDSACSRKQSFRMPSVVSKAIQLVRNDEVKQMAGNYDDSDFGDINNPESYFYQIHQMPRRIPKLIKLLISKTPNIYKPAVSQAVFPPLASHLCETRFRYLDNVEHEATISSILCAPTGSGKEAITQPINHIMADIRKRDAEQRERERAWKDECNRKGSNKDRRERPQGLIIQEVNIDMTNPAFVLRMKEAENHFLYSKVNELNLFDALKGKTNQHFRIMELAFDLGNYGQDRVSTQSVTETVKVRFNWNACCTPKKCRDYFKRVVTDGPISRISFCTIDRRPCGSELPVYGTYDAAFDEQLKPYIDNLVKARGLVECPEALKLAQKLLDENAQFARLSQDVVFENLSFRANVIAYLKACILYVANGMKWEKSIEDFVRWGERYDLYCKLKLFGQMIYDADRDQDSLPKTAPHGPKNLLELLPDEFSLKDYAKLRREQGFDDNRKRTMDAVYQWVSRGYVVKLLKDDSADTDTDSLIFRKVQYKRSYLLKKS